MSFVPDFSTLAGSTASLSALARGVQGSVILRIAAEIRALRARGLPVCNLTVGDFDPAVFPIPGELLEGTRRALAEGNTNYPPSDGVPALREAVAAEAARDLGVAYPVESVLVAAGARPLMYGAFRTLLDPGDLVLHQVPSWNSAFYVFLCGARSIELPVHVDSNFFPTAAQIEPHLPGARLLLLNTPLNPTGTVLDPEELRRIGELVLAENRRRAWQGRRPLYLVFDQVYRSFTFGKARHATPVGLVPGLAPYTILLDAISKSLCATGLRVGWGLMPPGMRDRMADLLGHIGAWAPKAEQVATARLLSRPDLLAPFHAETRRRVQERLDLLHEGFRAMRDDGLPVDVIEPQGAIYLSVQIDLFGRELGGTQVTTNQQIREHLLAGAGFAVVPFQAFGLAEESGWFRLSVGAVSLEEIEAALPRIRALIERACRP